MKTTYKLLGVFWDRLPCKEDLHLAYDETNIYNAHRISLFDLLSSSSIDNVERLLASQGKKTVVIVEKDFSVCSDNVVLNTFYDKRVRQIIAYLEKRFEHVYFINMIKP